MQLMQSRRRFLANLSLAGAAALIGAPKSAHTEPPPETARVRLPVHVNSYDCQAPEYIAGELLRAEGFTDVRFVSSGSGVDSAEWLARGELDFDWNFPLAHVRAIAAGAPIKVLSGMHAGCLELIADERIHKLTDLKGKRVGVDALTSVRRLLFSIMAEPIGLDAANDIHWITSPDVDLVERFAAGEIDAFLGLPPQPQEARFRLLGHAIVDTSLDPPWSQYFCCMLAGNADYVRSYPMATKRVLRAILKGVDLCVSEPARVAKHMVDAGFAARYDLLLESIKELRYDVWREYDPEDTIRFYALRMYEAGMIRSDPKTIIAEGTDWRFLDELKRELKG